MGKQDRLNEYRKHVQAIFDANTAAVLADGKWDDKEKAGTLVIITTSVLSHAAFLMATFTPHLKNAPPEAQIDDMLNLLRDVLVARKPISKQGLSVVEGGKP